MIKDFDSAVVIQGVVISKLQTIEIAINYLKNDHFNKL